MKIVEPKHINISYPIVPASVFKHHTDDLESIITMLICRIHESSDLAETDMLSNSAYLMVLATQLTTMLAHYQGDLIHSCDTHHDDKNPDYM